MLLILDIDETLLHATEVPLDRSADVTIGQYHVYLRPGLAAFLAYALRVFEVGIWSSAGDDYVHDVVSAIFDDTSSLAFVWGRSRNVARMDDGVVSHHVKDLKKVTRMGYDRNKILVVDDSPEKVERNYGNAILVRPYDGGTDDHELPLLQRYLEVLRAAPNVRSIEKRHWWRKLEGPEEPGQE